MKRFAPWLWALALCCWVLPVAAQTPPTQGAATTGEAGAEASVRQVFENYKRALVEGDGQRACSLVDRATFAYWEELRTLTLVGTEPEVRARTFIERLLIVSIRHQLSPEQLRGMTLEALIATAIAAGWISRASIEQLEMGTVSVSGDRALGQALTRASAADPGAAGVVDTLQYEFVREAGDWKFAFASLVRSLDRVIAELTAELGASEDDLIFTLVEAVSGRQVLPEVWQPPGR